MYVGSVAVLTAALAAAPAAIPVAHGQVAPTARVVVIAIPDLRWADVANMPRLQEWARTAAVGELSVTTVSGTPRCADGEMTFNAGQRVNALGGSSCIVSPTDFRATRDAAKRSAFAAEPGALGRALHTAGLRAEVVGDDARALLADEQAQVDEVTSLSIALKTADVVAIVDGELYATQPSVRADNAVSIDSMLAEQLAQVPTDATVMVAGISDGAGTSMHLHALFIRGPGWSHRALRSPSTRAPYVQLRDLAPTVLRQLHVPVPSSMGGEPAYATGKAVASAASYADDDRHAVRARWDGRVLRMVFAYAAAVVLLLFVLARWRPPALRLATALATVAVAAPVGSFLVQVVPWWRWSPWLYGVVLAAFGALVGVAIAAARKRSARRALVIGPAVTVAILISDQLAGASLQISAPLGDNPIVAARFHGMGNTDFALMCSAMLLCAGCLAPTLLRRRGLLVAAALCVVAIVVDGAPMLGDDFGGLLSMVPASALLLALLAGVRLTWRRLVAGAAAVGAVIVLVALADYARPRAHQTHVGRFVGQVLHGGAWPVIHRKLDASLGSFSTPGFTVLAGVALVVLFVERRRVASALGTISGLPAAAVALVVLAVLGTFLNDSGVVVGGAVIMLATLAVGASGVRPAEAAEDHGQVNPLIHGSSP